MNAPSNTIDPVVMMQVLLIVQFLGGMTLGLLQFLNSRSTQRRSVAMVEEFATRKELGALAEKVETKFDGLRCDLREMETRILDKGEERAVLLHNRLNEFGDRLGVLRGRVEGQEDK